MEEHQRGSITVFPDISYSPVTESITRFDWVQYNCFIFQKNVKARNLCLVYMLDELHETLKKHQKNKETTKT